MLYSMTGYGRAEQAIGDKNFLVELKSLNGKQFDLRLNIPALLKPYEFDVRNLLNEGLQRGSVECNITIKLNGAIKPVTINTDLAKAYFQPVAQLADELGLATGDILSTILKLPDVITPSTEMLSEAEWTHFETLLKDAIAQLNNHRKEEGKSIEADLLTRLQNIEEQPGRKWGIYRYGFNLLDIIGDIFSCNTISSGNGSNQQVVFIKKGNTGTVKFGFNAIFKIALSAEFPGFSVEVFQVICIVTVIQTKHGNQMRGCFKERVQTTAYSLCG